MTSNTSEFIRYSDPDSSVFEEATKSFFKVRIRDLAWHRIVGGVSGAKVYRVFAKVACSGSRFPRKHKEIIVKFSDQRMFNIERKKFRNLKPKRLRKHFVNFDVPEEQIDVWFCLIMPYLKKFDTLEKALFRVKNKASVENLTRAVFKNLLDLQFSADGLQRHPPILVAHRLYFSDIENSFLKALGHWSVLRDEISSAVEIFKELSEKTEDYQPPFVTRMHGDCHSRNIMIEQKNMTMKLIDIDEFQTVGDYILDFGELIADLNVYVPTKFKRKERNQNTHQLTQEAVSLLDRWLKEFAEDDSIGDYRWKKRLCLARARFLLKMLSTIDQGEKEKAQFILSEAVNAMVQADQT